MVLFLKNTGFSAGIGSAAAEGLTDADGEGERLADADALGLVDEIVEGEGDTDVG